MLSPRLKSPNASSVHILFLASFFNSSVELFFNALSIPAPLSVIVKYMLSLPLLYSTLSTNITSLTASAGNPFFSSAISASNSFSTLAVSLLCALHGAMFVVTITRAAIIQLINFEDIMSNFFDVFISLFLTL